MTTIARIQAADGREVWSRSAWHRVHPSQVPGARVWRVGPEGVLVRGESTARRTPGEPITLRGVVERYRDFVPDGFDAALVLAVVANESRGKTTAERFESRINDYSFGVMQTLTGTAHGLMVGAGMTPPDKPIPQGGSVAKWRRALTDPAVSIAVGTRYLMRLDQRFGLKMDPVLIYASYNAGSPRPTKNGVWGLMANRLDDPDTVRVEDDTLDHIAAWYGDACAVLREHAPLVA